MSKTTITLVFTDVSESDAQVILTAALDEATYLGLLVAGAGTVIDYKKD